MILQPKRIMELGVGSGKYGVLLREFLDIANGQLSRNAWATEIYGVEGWSSYINGLHDSVYNHIFIEDFSLKENYLKYRDFDLVLMADSLEHVPKDIGIELLSYLIENNKSVIVSCPFGFHYTEQGAVYGNEFERHRAHWKPAEFTAMGGVELFRGVCAVYQFGKTSN